MSADTASKRYNIMSGTRGRVKDREVMVCMRREQRALCGLDVDWRQRAVHGGRAGVGDGQADAAALTADHVKGEDRQIIVQVRV